ncbi:MAG: TIGR03790 family protein [Ignavibacterium sp.]|nr:TIGR03790 family protein [Ignavibacterium sp.]
MKHLLFYILFMFFFTQESEAQTNANIPSPENVLVVYKLPNGLADTLGWVSDSVKTYYQNARSIPESNILGLDNLVFNDTITYPSGGVWMDDYKEVYISDYNKAAWECYVDKIKTPIENYLNSTIVNGVALKNTIRYIVMCKGVPMKLLTYIDFNADLDPDPNVESNPSYWTKYNVSIDALTCLLYNPVINLYGTSYSSLSNPYYNQADMSFQFNKRFLTNYFHNGSWYVNYLVTRLDGNSYNDIIGMIDRANASDYTGNKWWIMDADTCHNQGVTKSVHSQNLIKNSLNRLKSYGFNTNPLNYDPWCDFILDNSIGSNEPVMGYTSCGRHSWMLLCNPEHNPAYIQLCLEFDYANGAIFNTFESYNGFSMYINNRYDDHGMVSEFIKMGGTCGVGHTWEPLLGGAAKNDNLFNLYQMGYSFADAAYQSIPILAWNNVVVGDPLTAIAWGKQTLLTNLNWSGANLVTGEVNIPSGKIFL